MKRALKIFLWIVVAAIFIATFLYMFNNSKSKPKEYTELVPTVTTIGRSTVLTGTIEPRDEINIKPQISGIISEILVEAGDHVKTGDILAKITIVPDEAQLSSAKSRINSAQIQLTDAKTRHARNEALFQKKVISREEYESTQKEVDQAAEELRAARDAYAIVKEGISPDNATGSNTLVRSTTTGLVLDVPVKVGTSVIQANTFNDGTTIATVADMTNLIFKGNVDETEVGNLKVGQPMEIIIGALPDRPLDASIEFISPKSTSTTGANTFEIKAGITVPKDVQIRSGYSANANVKLREAKDVLSVPESAIEYVGDSAFVYVLTDAKTKQYERRPVTLGLSDGINVEVKSGLDSNVKLRGPELTDNPMK